MYAINFKFRYTVIHYLYSVFLVIDLQPLITFALDKHTSIPGTCRTCKYNVHKIACIIIISCITETRHL